MFKILRRFKTTGAKYLSTPLNICKNAPFLTQLINQSINQSIKSSLIEEKSPSDTDAGGVYNRIKK